MDGYEGVLGIYICVCTLMHSNVVRLSNLSFTCR